MYHPPVVLIFIFVFSCCCLCLSLPIYPVINLSINPVDQSVDQSVSNTLSINPVDQSVSNNRAQPKTNPPIFRRPDNAEPAEESLPPPDDLSLDRDSPRRLGAPIAYFVFFVFSCCCLCLSLPIYPVINLSINPVDQSVDQSVSNTLSINPVDQSVSNNQLAVDLPCRSILLPNQPSVL